MEEKTETKKWTDEQASSLAGLVTWLIILSIGMVFFGVDVLIMRFTPSKPLKLPSGMLRLVSGQIQAYDTDYDKWHCANRLTKNALGLNYIVYFEGSQLKQYSLKGGWYAKHCIDTEVAKAVGLPSLQAQINYLNCESHEWKYIDSDGGKSAPYRFKCAKCDKRIWKCVQKLTLEEREALGCLGIIEKCPTMTFTLDTTIQSDSIDITEMAIQWIK